MTVVERPLAQPGEEQEGVQEEILRPRCWTRDEYYRLGEAGFFENERVELLDGEIWTLPPQKAPHFSSVEAASEILGDAFGAGHSVRGQGPMTLDDGTEPEPDVLIVAGSRMVYQDHHPTPPKVRFLVEVSDATLAKDRDNKMQEYAQAGIVDYWIINLVSRQIEVHRVLLEGESIAPLLAPDRPVNVTDLLPLRSPAQP